MRIEYSPSFERMYKKLDPRLQDRAETREVIFRKNPFNSILKTHKLSGSLKDKWAFSIDHKHRIIFSFENKEVIRFHAIGNHDIYDLI